MFHTLSNAVHELSDHEVMRHYYQEALKDLLLERFGQDNIHFLGYPNLLLMNLCQRELERRRLPLPPVALPQQALERIPEGYAFVEMSDGRWFVAYAPDVSCDRVVVLLPTSSPIPPALDPVDAQGVGYASRAEALAACHEWRESIALLCKWRELAEDIEVYPERNSWYLEEIQRLVGSALVFLSCWKMCALVEMRTEQGTNHTISAFGLNRDEAIERLYQQVYEWACHPSRLKEAS